MTIIECKDYAKIVTVTEVDALHSKLQDVRAQKAVLVARKGFSKTAVAKARRLGITLCTAHEAKSEKWPFQLQIPFVIEELCCKHTFQSFTFVAIENMRGISLTHFSGIPFSQIIAAYWKTKEIICNEGMNEHCFTPPIAPPITARTSDGRDFTISEFQITMQIEKNYYFGYLNELDSVKCLEFIDPKKRHIILEPNSLANYREKLVRYSMKADIPNVSRLIQIPVKLLFNPSVTWRVADPKLVAQ